MESKKIAIILLSVLLAVSIGIILFLVFTNPVRGFTLVYDRPDYKLYMKSAEQEEGKKNFLDLGGKRIKHPDGVDMIANYRKEIITHDDSMKMTRYVDFNFDSVFTYLGYVLSIKSKIIAPTDTLGIRVYIGRSKEARTVEGQQIYYKTMLFAPIKGHNLHALNDPDIDFLDQGSICPVNCPDDYDNGQQPPPTPLTNKKSK